MRLLGLHIVEEFSRHHPTSRSSLNRWVRLMRENNFKSFSELRKLFPAADQVGSKTVFNVGGNKIRAITLIEYGIQQVLITHVLTHHDYDRERWKR